jgi:hypothetical protein
MRFDSHMSYEYGSVLVKILCYSMPRTRGRTSKVTAVRELPTLIRYRMHTIIQYNTILQYHTIYNIIQYHAVTSVSPPCLAYDQGSASLLLYTTYSIIHTIYYIRNPLDMSIVNSILNFCTSCIIGR